MEIIRKTLDAGMVFLYGMVLDVTTRTVADFERELDGVLATPEITLPAYVSVSIPILGTPFLSDCLRDDRVLPRTRVRDLDGTTLSVRSHDDQPRVERFVRDLMGFHGRRARVARHAVGFARRWHSVLTREQMVYALGSGVVLCAPVLASAPSRWWRRTRRTYVSTTEVLDGFYRPAFPVAARFESYFEPTMLTDTAGRLNEALADDLLGDHERVASTRG